VTVEEAAHCCGVPRSQFRENALDYGIRHRHSLGKQVYNIKAALYAAILGTEDC